MLSKPNVKEIMPKVGNRYESALAIAKRARYIENRRIVEGSSDIRDAVDVAANEIADGKVLVKKDGEYVDKELIKKDSVLKDEITDIVEE
mgnify:CR=1 FL=1